MRQKKKKKNHDDISAAPKACTYTDANDLLILKTN